MVTFLWNLSNDLKRFGEEVEWIDDPSENDDLVVAVATVVLVDVGVDVVGVEYFVVFDIGEGSEKGIVYIQFKWHLLAMRGGRLIKSKLVENLLLSF